MKIIRFDEEVAMRLTGRGSNFSMAPLTGSDSAVRVHVLHVPPGGLVAKHETASPQMLAVLAGTGWATGGDGKRRDLVAGRGVIWDAGEIHETGSEAGLTAVCIEGAFESWAFVVTKDIAVVDYDESWPSWFDQIVEYVWPSVRDVAVRIDHVGSTAVPGLPSKPIIDLDIVVATENVIGEVIGRLTELGYRWRGEMGVEGRQAFSAAAPMAKLGLPEHHLYVVVENNRAHMDHWLLRDLLREDEEARRRYGDLKRRNAQLADSDIDVYVAAKAGYVAELLAKARQSRGLAPVEYWQP